MRSQEVLSGSAQNIFFRNKYTWVWTKYMRSKQVFLGFGPNKYIQIKYS